MSKAVRFFLMLFLINCGMTINCFGSWSHDLEKLAAALRLPLGAWAALDDGILAYRSNLMSRIVYDEIINFNAGFSDSIIISEGLPLKIKSPYAVTIQELRWFYNIVCLFCSLGCDRQSDFSDQGSWRGMARVFAIYEAYAALCETRDHAADFGLMRELVNRSYQVTLCQLLSDCCLLEASFLQDSLTVNQSVRQGALVGLLILSFVALHKDYESYFYFDDSWRIEVSRPIGEFYSFCVQHVNIRECVKQCDDIRELLEKLTPLESLSAGTRRLFIDINIACTRLEIAMITFLKCRKDEGAPTELLFASMTYAISGLNDFLSPANTLLVERSSEHFEACELLMLKIRSLRQTLVDYVNKFNSAGEHSVQPCDDQKNVQAYDAETVIGGLKALPFEEHAA